MPTCATCLLPTTLCICGLVRPLETRTRLVLVVASLEARKPSNTGQLAARCLARSTVQLRRKGSGPQPSPAISDGETPLVLFPSTGASPITHYAKWPSPIALIVPDGSWSQARHWQQHGPLRQYPCVTLPALGPSEYRLRDEPQPGGLATLEAIARALGILDGEQGAAVRDAMLAVFRAMVERTLWFRGKLATHDVSSGIPPAALIDDPRGAFTRARVHGSSVRSNQTSPSSGTV